jgi:hypothetical protein
MPRKRTPQAIDHDQLIAAATEGLAGIAHEGEVGEFLPATETDGVLTIQARSLQRGYPGWLWTVLLTPAEDGRLTVTEVTLLPGEDSLLSPDWVPWSERLEDYRRQEAEREASELLDPDTEVDDDLDDDDFDDVLDGIDIDQLDLDLDPTPLELPGEPNDVFDHVEIDDED